MTKVFSIQSLLVRITLFLILLSITMPSGSIYGFNIKIAASILILFLLVFDIIRTRSVQKSLLVIVLSFCVFFILTISVAFHNAVPIESVLSQTLAFASVLMIVLPVIYVLEKKYIKNFEFIKFIYAVTVLHCVIKVVVELHLMLGVISVLSLRTWIPSVFGADILLLDYGFFYRLNMSGDFILPFAVFCFFTLPEITCNKTYRIFSIAIILFSLFITYSRYLWLYGAISIALGYLVSPAVARGGLTFGAFLAKRLYISFVILLLGVGVLVMTGLSDEVLSRFVGSNAISSDSQREEMYPPLRDKYTQHPVLGVGMGGYTDELIRVERLPWNYELQWLSFAMQFGLVGVLFLGFVAVSPVIVYFKKDVLYVAISLMYVLWISVGFFNSFLITSASGVVYSAYIAFWKLLNSR